jgi:hypothetical protein
MNARIERAQFQRRASSSSTPSIAQPRYCKSDPSLWAPEKLWPPRYMSAQQPSQAKPSIIITLESRQRDLRAEEVAIAAQNHMMRASSERLLLSTIQTLSRWSSAPIAIAWATQLAIRVMRHWKPVWRTCPQSENPRSSFTVRPMTSTLIKTRKGTSGISPPTTNVD